MSDQSEATLTSSLLKFFSVKEHIDKVVPIVNRSSIISLRLLDYFCVNYSRSNPVVFMLNGVPFDVHASYKSQLKLFSKRTFDPFRRSARIALLYETDQQSERFHTTLGQLCFFRWCILCNILEYIERNVNLITEDMKRVALECPVAEEVTMGTPVVLGRVSGVGGGVTKRKGSRRKSDLVVTATRVPAPFGQKCVIVTFE